MVSTSSGSSYRWRILRNAIVKKTYVEQEKENDEMFAHSVRCFTSFGLFSLSSPSLPWKLYSCPEVNQSKPAWIKEEQGKIDIKDMMAYNNTGNVCIWPAEEVMAYHCLVNKDQFSGKSVIEIGGGKSSLAGVMLALNQPSASRVLISEGDDKCIGNLKEIVARNDARCEVSKLRWDQPHTYSHLESAFDFLICADCTFFVESHSCLVSTIAHVLKPGGRALLFSPRRGTTLAQFMRTAEQSAEFSSVRELDHGSEKLKHLHQSLVQNSKIYNPDIHYPVLVQLQRRLPLKK